MNYVIFDLEWNGCYCKKLDCYINEIIEIGAVKLDEQLNITNKFSILVRPEIGKRLSSSVKTLTSLTYEELVHGAPFRYAYSKFKKFCTGSILMTWSTSDIDALVSNVKYHYKQDKIDFMKQYADIQQYCHDMLGLNDMNALGLQAAAEMLEIDTYDIPQHRATFDSIVSSLCLKKLYHKEALQSYIVDTSDGSFYERLFFRPYFITDIKDSDVDRNVMFFNCPECGARAVRKTEWEEKHKGFIAEFQCPECKHDFNAKIQFKKKYDSVNVIKKLVKLPKTADKTVQE